MARSTAIAAVALSIQELLNRCFVAMEADPTYDAFRALPIARVVRSEDLTAAGAQPASPIRFPTLSILCHRLEVNRQTRPRWSALGAEEGRVHLPLDVHLLLTAWDSDAEAELRILGATMQCMEQHPVLTGPALHPLGGWTPGEAVQLTVHDMGTEDVMRTFDTLPADFRLSVAYCARIARIEGPGAPLAGEVATVIRGLTPSPVPLP